MKCFVIKAGAANDIITCIEAVMNGQSFFSSVRSQFLLNRRNEQKSMLENLTAAERRVMRPVAEGKTTKEIADELFISLRSVDHHRTHLGKAGFDEQKRFAHVYAHE